MTHLGIAMLPFIQSNRIFELLRLRGEFVKSEIFT